MDDHVANSTVQNLEIARSAKVEGSKIKEQFQILEHLRSVQETGRSHVNWRRLPWIECATLHFHDRAHYPIERPL